MFRERTALRLCSHFFVLVKHIVDYLNPDLDAASCKDILRSRGRVQIPDFFAPSVADALYEAVRAVDWGLAYRSKAGDEFLTGSALRAFTPNDRGTLAEQILRGALNAFQFSFLSHSIVAAAQSGHTDLLSRFALWMAQDDFLSTMRELTGDVRLNRVYAQATCYSPGSFLLVHDDEVQIEKRRVAYVINLTRDWRPDWGGLLHFCDGRAKVIETFVPLYNSLSLFTVPQEHFVSFVAPYAQSERLAITGWLIES